MKLLDTKVINGGVYIDRSKNLSKDYYDVIEGDLKTGKGKDMKITFVKKQKVILGKELGIDFEQLMSQRKPQGLNTGFKPTDDGSPTEDSDVSIIQLDIQFSSNLRLGLQHESDPLLTIGAPHNYTKEFENHVLRFERYFKLPLELKVIKEKMQKEAMMDAKKLKELRDEEILNPWLVTDLDFTLDGNPYVK